MVSGSKVVVPGVLGVPGKNNVSVILAQSDRVDARLSTWHCSDFILLQSVKSLASSSASPSTDVASISSRSSSNVWRNVQQGDSTAHQQNRQPGA